MRATRFTSLVLGSLLVAAAPLIAADVSQTAAIPPSPSPWKPNITTPREKSSKPLFQVPDLTQAAQRMLEAQTNGGQRPSVVCGMTVFPTDPRIDPQIRRGPHETGVDHTIRSFTSPACK